MAYRIFSRASNAKLIYPSKLFLRAPFCLYSTIFPVWTCFFSVLKRVIQGFFQSQYWGISASECAGLKFLSLHFFLTIFHSWSNIRRISFQQKPESLPIRTSRNFWSNQQIWVEKKIQILSQEIFILFLFPFKFLIHYLQNWMWTWGSHSCMTSHLGRHQNPSGFCGCLYQI